jgi:Ala-tRNA(Pro) deacylase
MDLVKFLKKNEVPFQLRHHPARFTAQEVAAAEHISGEEVVKAVIVRVDGRFAMCVLPATYQLKMDQVRKVLGGKDVRLATEEEIGKLFPDSQVGAMPPFGGQYGVEIWAEDALAADDEILVPAGTHEDSILMTWLDYERLAKPRLVHLGEHKA